VVWFSVRALLKYWLPVFLWLLFIFIGSTDLMSADHTSRFIGPFLRWFSPNIAAETIASVQLVVRKCAHLTEYAILASFLLRAFRQGSDRHWRAASFAFVVAAICASVDEFHQSFVASRTGSSWDVMIDCFGAAFGLVLCFIFRRKTARSSTSVP
jgi:VanZ family protein